MKLGPLLPLKNFYRTAIILEASDTEAVGRELCRLLRLYLVKATERVAQMN